MAALTTETGACPTGASCTAIGTGYFTFWMPKAYSATERTGTVMVVQVINTIENTTRLSTVANQLPPGYVPPPTNSGGTRIATITYRRHGTRSTSTLAYPTPFLVLPDAYTIVGDYQLGSSSGAQRCVRHANQTFNIPINHQPPWRDNDPTWNVTKYLDPLDPLGWGYSYLETSNLTLFETINRLVDVLPDDNPNMPHAVVKSCKSETLPQPYMVSANPDWRVVAQTSVVYEGRGTPAHITPTGKMEPTGKTEPVVASRTGEATQDAKTGSGGSIKAVWPLWAMVWVCSVAAACAAM